MGKKEIVLVSLLVIIIIAISIMFYTKKEPYSDNPKKWIVEKEDDVIEVDVDKATKGEGYLDINGQQYRSENVNTVFRYEGYYKGERFYDGHKDSNDNVLMRVGNDIKPSDGVIEGFIVVKIKDGMPIFNIFIDDDWKNKVKPTNVMHGIDNKIEILNFEEIKSGIFYSKIETDSGFFENFKFHLESVMVGDFTQEKIDNENNDITMMVIR